MVVLDLLVDFVFAADIILGFFTSVIDNAGKEKYNY
jgi:hypothetical protein